MITKVKNFRQSMIMASNFEYNPNTTTGLNFGYYEGNVHDSTGAIQNFPASTIAVPAGGTYTIYLDVQVATPTINVATLGSITSDVFIPLYEVVTDGSGITSVTDLRSSTTYQIGPEV